MTTPEIFKAIRAKLGNEKPISQGELSRRLGIDRKHITRYEGGRSIGFDLLCSYLEKLNLSFSEILTE